MPKAPWKYDASTGRAFIAIPTSVERVGGFDDSALLHEGYPTARWSEDGKGLVLSPRDLVEVVTTVAHLASDQIHEDLSVGGALRWARRLTEELRKAGWATYRGVGYEPTEAAIAAGNPS